ncbi:MAG: RING-H2 finger protein [Zetaproteobacteria bacterium]|nr:RING-H2 finger protein [Zetaproteobacteria bacterium]
MYQANTPLQVESLTTISDDSIRTQLKQLLKDTQKNWRPFSEEVYYLYMLNPYVRAQNRATYLRKYEITAARAIQLHHLFPTTLAYLQEYIRRVKQKEGWLCSTYLTYLKSKKRVWSKHICNYQKSLRELGALPTPQALQGLHVSSFTPYLPQTLLEGSIEEGCAICTEDLHTGETIYELPCSHVFHKPCLDHWAQRRKTTCPLCRQDFAVDY